jgi:hypothetical protein
MELSSAGGCRVHRLISTRFRLILIKPYSARRQLAFITSADRPRCHAQRGKPRKGEGITRKNSWAGPRPGQNKEAARNPPMMREKKNISWRWGGQAPSLPSFRFQNLGRLGGPLQDGLLRTVMISIWREPGGGVNPNAGRQFFPTQEIRSGIICRLPPCRVIIMDGKRVFYRTLLNGVSPLVDFVPSTGGE